MNFMTDDGLSTGVKNVEIGAVGALTTDYFNVDYKTSEGTE